MKTIKLNSHGIKVIENGFKKPLKNTKSFFNSLGSLMFQQQVPLVFARSGAAYGHEKWKSYEPSTIYTDAGTKRIKRGTDGTPRVLGKNELKELKKIWGYGHRGYMRKGVRRYPGMLLQASGYFKKAFKIIKTNNKGMEFGLSGKWDKLGSRIMSGGGKNKRNVLFVTNILEKEYKNLWKEYFKKELKF